MADEDEKKGPTETVGQAALAVLAGVAILVVLWFANGGYKRADLRGLFIAPPAPVGPGGSYGPQVGQPNPNIPTNQ